MYKYKINYFALITYTIISYTYFIILKKLTYNINLLIYYIYILCMMAYISCNY